MATLNLVLDTRRVKADGTFPLVFRIRLGKKYSDISTGFSILVDDFDIKTSSVKNDLLLNDQLNELESYYLKRLRTYLVTNVGREDIKEARKQLTKRDVSDVTIIEFWKEQIASLIAAGRHGGARVHKTSLSVISQESDLNIPFTSFTFKNLLTLESNLYKRGLSINGLGVYLRSFRTVCNQAVKLDLVSYEWYPFRKYTISKERKTPRVLSLSELNSYVNLSLDQSDPLYRSWQIGKLIFMLRGINITDLLLLKSDNIKGDRIIYKRAKTSKIYSVLIHEEVKHILDSIKINDSLIGLINSDELKSTSRLMDIISMRRKVVNSHLKKIGELINAQEPITTYVFRYSYSNIAKRLGYSKDLIAEALGHEYGNSVTGIYLEHFDMEIVDEMNATIIKKVWGRIIP